ncbi:hypothetical protein IOD40_12020 [Aquamicrobium sp. cd-1]|uniref:HpcH/HpaI aldolase/citrate lyase domain-containing protein n=1 Tax=Aquamicrobium zhengzhouense TaxID=2781738 RepID=A0ABS0SDL0_9HYPH|nr:hypothetical protein [Aquamicrobium zhengzhouense]
MITKFDFTCPLFVPGDRPDRFEKAAASGADAIILDLEDAVSVAAKDTARNHLRSVFTALPVIIRVNAVNTIWRRRQGDTSEPDGNCLWLQNRYALAGRIPARSRSSA